MLKFIHTNFHIHIHLFTPPEFSKEHQSFNFNVFKLRNTPAPEARLFDFEQALYKLVNKNKFKKYNNNP